LNSGLHACEADTLPLEPRLHPSRKFLTLSCVTVYFSLLSENGIDPENNQEITHGKVRKWTTMYLEILELRPQPSHSWNFFLNALQRSIYFLLTVQQYL
jgi:hypothetical protein